MKTGRALAEIAFTIEWLGPNRFVVESLESIPHRIHRYNEGGPEISHECISESGPLLGRRVGGSAGRMDDCEWAES